MTRILLIDDEPAVRTTLRDVLEDAGYDVVEAADGNEGHGLFLSTPVDIVITDILMPEKDGLETIMALRRANPDVKIIAMSGGGRNRSLGFLYASEAFGAGHILCKPFAAEEIVRTVQSVLEQKP